MTMPLSFQKQLQSLSDKHNLNGDQQSRLGKMFSLTGESYLFEFYSKEDAEEILKRINFLGIDEALTMCSADSNEKIDSSIAITHNDDIVNTEVVDEDGEVVIITQELRDAFLMDHGKLVGGFWQMAFALSSIRKKKSYLAGGFAGFKDYVIKSIPLGLRQSYDYAMVGDEFANYEDKLLSGEGPNLGITKTKMIARQGNKQVDRLIETGEIQWGDEFLTEEELQNETITSLRARLQMAEENQKKAEEKSQKAELLEEKLKNATMEKEDLEQFHSRHQERVENEERIEAILNDAWHHVTVARREVSKIDLDSIYSAEEATPKAHELADLYYRLTTYMEETARFIRTKNIYAVEEYLFLQDDQTQYADNDIDEVLNNKDSQ